MEKLNFLDEVILDDSEMLEICGGTSIISVVALIVETIVVVIVEMIVGMIAEVAPLKIS